MERSELAPGFTISRVLTGLWQVADQERGGRALDLDAAAAAMAPYVAAGYTTFDMADHYGSAEIIAGKFVAASDPGAVEICTKWVPEPTLEVCRRTVRAAVERSLERLGAERIDLLQFHAWNYADPGYLDSLFQTHFVIDKIEGALASLGGGLEDVVRTRTYVRDLAHWEPVARVHGERFADVLPANTLVQAGLVGGDDYLVEMEAEAELAQAPASPDSKSA